MCDINTMSLKELEDLHTQVDNLISERYIDISNIVSEKVQIGDTITVKGGLDGVKTEKGVVNHVCDSFICVSGITNKTTSFHDVRRIVRDTELIFDWDTVQSIGKRQSL